MDWDLIFSSFVFPGPFVSGISKTEFLNLTYPQLIILIKSFGEEESKSKFHHGKIVSVDEIPRLLAQWYKEDKEKKDGS